MMRCHWDVTGMSLACHAVTVTDECDTQSGMCVTHSPMAGLEGYMCGWGWGVPKIALWIITYSERVIFLLQIELPHSAR